MFTVMTKSTVAPTVGVLLVTVLVRFKLATWLDEMNHNIRTVIAAPMTTHGKAYPTRVACRFKGKNGQIVLDQIRTVDQVRLVKKLGRLDSPTATRVLEVLQEMFAA